MSDPVKLTILANIKTTLEGITVAAGYNQTLRQVHDRRPMFSNDPSECPVVYFFEENTANDEEFSQNRTRRVMTVMVGHYSSGDGRNPKPALERLVADVEKALTTDRTRNGVAIDTIPGNEEPEVIPNETPSGICWRDYTVIFRTPHGDPYTVA